MDRVDSVDAIRPGRYNMDRVDGVDANHAMMLYTMNSMRRLAARGACGARLRHRGLACQRVAAP